MASMHLGEREYNRHHTELSRRDNLDTFVTIIQEIGKGQRITISDAERTLLVHGVNTVPAPRQRVVGSAELRLVPLTSVPQRDEPKKSHLSSSSGLGPHWHAEVEYTPYTEHTPGVTSLVWPKRDLIMRSQVVHLTVLFRHRYKAIQVHVKARIQSGDYRVDKHGELWVAEWIVEMKKEGAEESGRLQQHVIKKE
ncbi:hypothetical protein LTR66_010994 [Elasticomyces elasticus]|nr:hypothetical protein LTR66_010994 [Elasticomyces elasticus]KAK5008270.1 hypothetical protein LTR28_004211 [Elasticomyces elasticus]